MPIWSLYGNLVLVALVGVGAARNDVLARRPVERAAPPGLGGPDAGEGAAARAGEDGLESERRVPEGGAAARRLSRGDGLLLLARCDAIWR